MGRFNRELPHSKVCEIIDNMPAVFYRYTFDGEKIIKTEIAKKYPNMTAWERKWNQTFEIRTVQSFNHRYSWLQAPWEIKFGEYDKRRKAVFLEEDDDKKAAKIIADFYYGHYEKCLNHALEAYKTSMDLNKYSKGGTNND